MNPKETVVCVVAGVIITIAIVWLCWVIGAIQHDQCVFGGGHDGYSSTLNCCYEDQFNSEGEWLGYVCVGEDWNDTESRKKTAPKPEYLEDWRVEIKYIDCDHSVICYGKKLSTQLTCTHVPEIQECEEMKK